MRFGLLADRNSRSVVSAGSFDTGPSRISRPGADIRFPEDATACIDPGCRGSDAPVASDERVHVSRRDVVVGNGDTARSHRQVHAGLAEKREVIRRRPIRRANPETARIECEAKQSRL